MDRYTNSARWFALSFESRTPAIQIAIWGRCADQVTALLKTHSGIPEVLEQWRFNSFESDMRKDCGFDRVIRAHGVVNGYQVLTIPLQRKTMDQAAASLMFLLSTLQYLPDFCESILFEPFEPDTNHMQLMVLETQVQHTTTPHSAPLYGAVSPALTEWVARTWANNDNVEHTAQCMCHAWNALSRRDHAKYSGGRFSARLGENGSFALECVGDACEVLTIDWWTREPGEGHELGCHNLDSPAQQLCLLAGLAGLHDLACKELDNHQTNTS